MPAPPLSIYALGRLRVFVGDEEIPVDAWKSQKALLVFRYLVTQGASWPEPVSREAIMEAVWPDEHPARVEQSLRAALSAVRRTLQPEMAKWGRSAYVRCRGGRCTLVLGEGGRFDVAQFIEGVERAVRLAHAGDAEGAAAARREALALYRGDFLECAPYAEWAWARRERLRNLYATTLLSQGRHELNRGAFDQAAELGLEMLELEPSSERAYHLALRAYARGGHWGRVRVLYDRYRAMMSEYGFAAPATLEDLLKDAPSDDSSGG